MQARLSKEVADYKGETQMSDAIQTQMLDIKLAAASVHPTDILGIADVLMSEALEFCAEKLNLCSSEAVINRLRQRDGVCYRYWHYGLAKKLGRYLGMSDESIRAVYLYDYDTVLDDICPSEVVPDMLIHLVIWSRRKTAALNSLMEGLDKALAQAHAKLLGMDEPSHLLDAHVVDDYEFENRLGYGALFASLYHRPLPVWKR
jgi:hypothetical protein